MDDAYPNKDQNISIICTIHFISVKKKQTKKSNMVVMLQAFLEIDWLT